MGELDGSSSYLGDSGPAGARDAPEGDSEQNPDAAAFSCLVAGAQARVRYVTAQNIPVTAKEASRLRAVADGGVSSAE